MLSVLVANSKGGCGKTTISTHLAAAFANQGLRTALADADRQRSSLGWVGRRPAHAPGIEALDWAKDVGAVPKKVERLVIDAAAALRRKHVVDLVKMADVIVVPVLPSVYDQTATSGFLETLGELKPVRKNKKPVAIVRNRVRARSRAASRLDRFLDLVEHQDLGGLPERSASDELAADGLALFDLDGKRAERLRADWQPLLSYVEAA
jgi:chromosome partitioning protein